MEPHRWGYTILVLLTALLLLPGVHALGCRVATSNGMLPDVDCDGVPDAFDNCPSVHNPDQYDTNRNGIGDACDSLIEEVHVNPDSHIQQGEMAHITARLINNRDADISDLALTITNKDLGIDTTDTLPFIPAGQTAVLDFWLPIPKCAKVQAYPLSISVAFQDPSVGARSTEVQKQTIYVEKNNVCNAAAGPLDNTIIKVFDQVDVDRGENALLPITIVNLNSEQVTYDLALDDQGMGGSWRIDPNSRVIIPAGHDDSRYLYVQTEQWTQPGTHTVVLSVTSGNQKTEVPIKVYVRGTQFASGVPIFPIIFQILLIVLVLALIVFAIVIAVRSTRRNGKQRAGNHEVEPYYDDAKPTAAKAARTAPRKTVSIEPAEERRAETYY